MKQLLLLFLLVLNFAGCDTYSVVSSRPVEPLERLPHPSQNKGRSLARGRLPANPDPNKCYVRVISTDKFETTSKTYLTYSKLEADEYPHTQVEIVTRPAHSRWEYTDYEGCESPNPADCQVLCYRNYYPAIDTIYVPVDSLEGNPFEQTIEIKTMYEKGGLRSWEEIDCELTSFSVLPILFGRRSAELSESDRKVIDVNIVSLLKDHPFLQLDFTAHTDSRGDDQQNLQLSEDRLTAISDYLFSQGIDRNRIITKGYGETRLRNRCANGVHCSDPEHAINSRIEFRALNAGG